MTDYLIATRAAIIFWTTLAVIPAEIVFDAIKAELGRRGVEPFRCHSLRELFRTVSPSGQKRVGRLA
jgi:hypothetical protein